MLASVDEDGSGSIDFGEFIQVIKEQQASTDALGDDTDSALRHCPVSQRPNPGCLTDAPPFVLLSSFYHRSQTRVRRSWRQSRLLGDDQCGEVKKNMPGAFANAWVSVLRNDFLNAVAVLQAFELTIDIDQLIKQYDTDGSGEIE